MPIKNNAGRFMAKTLYRQQIQYINITLNWEWPSHLLHSIYLFSHHLHQLYKQHLDHSQTQKSQTPAEKKKLPARNTGSYTSHSDANPTYAILQYMESQTTTPNTVTTLCKKLRILRAPLSSKIFGDEEGTCCTCSPLDLKTPKSVKKDIILYRLYTEGMKFACSILSKNAWKLSSKFPFKMLFVSWQNLCTDNIKRTTLG